MSNTRNMSHKLPRGSSNPVHDLVEAIAKMCAHRTRARKARDAEPTLEPCEELKSNS